MRPEWKSRFSHVAAGPVNPFFSCLSLSIVYRMNRFDRYERFGSTIVGINRFSAEGDRLAVEGWNRLRPEKDIFDMVAAEVGRPRYEFEENP